MSTETAEEFEIYITENGPRLIKEAGRIEILHIIDRQSEHRFKAVELCSIMCLTEQPKSSVFSSLKSMVKSGILKVDLVDGKKGYLINGYRLVGSVKADESLHGFARKTVDDNSELSSLSLLLLRCLGSFTLSHGIDLSPLFRSIGHDVGKWILSDSGSTKEAMDKLLDLYKNSGLVEVSLVSSLPPMVETRFMNPCLSDTHAQLISTLTAESLAAILGAEIGCEFTIDSQKTGEGLSIISRLRNYTANEFIDLIPSKYTYSNDAASEFIVHITKDMNVGLITSHLSRAILDIMPANIPLSSAEITKKLGESIVKPQSSVLFHLEKMIDAGIVDSVNINGKRKFIKSSSDLFSWNADFNMPYEIDSDVRHVLSHPDELIDYLLCIMVKRLGSLCINIEPVIAYIGKKIASDLCDSVSVKNIETVVGRLTDARWFGRSNVNATSFFPFTIIRKFDKKSNEITEYLFNVFDLAFFSEILAKLGGCEYAADSTRIENDMIYGYSITYRQIK